MMLFLFVVSKKEELQLNNPPSNQRPTQPPQRPRARCQSQVRPCLHPHPHLQPHFQQPNPHPSHSRLDAYYGNNHLFNPATFASSKSFWTTSLLSAQQLANSKLARQIDSRAYNPTYTFTATMEQFSLGELAAPIIAFGDSEEGTADRALVEYFFGEWPCVFPIEDVVGVMVGRS
jgi:hypothetical protein